MDLNKILEAYKPSEEEEFMNPTMKEYFKQKLLRWKALLEEENRISIKNIQKVTENKIADSVETATYDVDMAFDLRTRDRARKLISKIESSLAMIEDGSYGYCLGTGDPISIKRLEARPIATYSIEHQEKHERKEKNHI